jgi:hypothetical protein
MLICTLWEVVSTDENALRLTSITFQTITCKFKFGTLPITWVDGWPSVVLMLDENKDDVYGSN